MAATYLLILMKKQTTTLIVAATGFLLASCQNQPTATQTSSPAPPVTKPLPTWTQSKKASKSSRQVKIVSKVIEITRESDSTETPSKRYTKMMNPGEVESYLRKLSRKKGADIMTSPSVVARDGQTAKIELGRDFTYPSSEKPGEFKTELIGIAQYFRARSLGYNRKFKLDTLVKVTELEGIDPSAVKGEKEPVIQTRRVEDSVTIASGQSIVFGGHITNDEQEVEDKLPLLGDIPLIGRLFSSESTHEFKRELIVLITLTEIDRSGKELISSGRSR